MKIGIIIGSVRDTRAGVAVAEWIEKAAAERAGFEYEIVDLKRFDVPLLTSTTLPAAAGKKYENAYVQAWSEAVDACAGFIFVTAEYNHGIPGAFKNAYDSLGDEWRGKPVAFASYGANDGVRAVEQWRQVVANFSQQDVRSQLAVNRFVEFNQDGTEFTPNERRAQELGLLFDELEAAVRRTASDRG